MTHPPNRVGTIFADRYRVERMVETRRRVTLYAATDLSLAQLVGLYLAEFEPRPDWAGFDPPIIRD